MSLQKELLVESSVELLIGTIQDARYSILAAHILQFYEWITSLDDEIRLVIRSSWTSVKVAYLVCRYYPLLLWFFLEWAYVGDHPLALCTRLVRPIHGLLMPLSLSAQAVLFMRAFAFSGRNCFVLLTLILCYSFLVGTHVWMFCVNVPTFTITENTVIEKYRGGVGCFADYRVEAMGHRVAFAMFSILVMDFASLTIVVAYCIWRPSRRTSLGKYFLRQGLSSFAFTSILSTVGLSVYFRAQGSYGGIGLPFIFALPDLLACRLILQLRRRAIPSDTQISRQNSRIIRRALGSTHRNSTSDIWVIEDES